MNVVIAGCSLEFLHLIGDQVMFFFFFFQAEDGIRDLIVTGVQTRALPIFERLRTVRARKAVLVNLLDYLGLALALEPEREQGAGSEEREMLFKVAKFYTLGRYSDALTFYEMERERSGGDSGPPVDEVIRQLGGRTLMTRLRAEPDPAQRYPAAVARLRALIDEPSPPGTLQEESD